MFCLGRELQLFLFNSLRRGGVDRRGRERREGERDSDFFCIIIIVHCKALCAFPRVGISPIDIIVLKRAYWFRSWVPRIPADRNRCRNWRSHCKLHHSDTGSWHTRSRCLKHSATVIPPQGKLLWKTGGNSHTVIIKDKHRDPMTHRRQVSQFPKTS